MLPFDAECLFSVAASIRRRMRPYSENAQQRVPHSQDGDGGRQRTSIRRQMGALLLAESLSIDAGCSACLVGFAGAWRHCLNFDFLDFRIAWREVSWLFAGVSRLYSFLLLNYGFGGWQDSGREKTEIPLAIASAPSFDLKSIADKNAFQRDPNGTVFNRFTHELFDKQAVG